jgi:hypothetical protein
VGAAGPEAFDPGDRLAVRAGVADRPLEQVLEGSGQCARVFGRAQQERVGRGDLRAQLGHGGIDRLTLAIVVRIEVRQPAHAVIHSPGHAWRRYGARRLEHSGVRGFRTKAARHHQDLHGPRHSRAS